MSWIVTRQPTKLELASEVALFGHSQAQPEAPILDSYSAKSSDCYGRSSGSRKENKKVIDSASLTLERPSKQSLTRRLGSVNCRGRSRRVNSADRSQGMVCWHTLLRGNVAEHSFLVVIVAAHSLVSLTFLLSDEFLYIKVAAEPRFFNKLLAGH
jgi:hypothetical protein